MNLRPSGYEPDELPGCSTPRQLWQRLGVSSPVCFVSPSSAFRPAVGSSMISCKTGSHFWDHAVGCCSTPGLFFDQCEEAAVKRPCIGFVKREAFKTCVWQTWQRPTLPCLKTKYHWRRGVSRPCSEWERVQPPRNNHQVGKTHVLFKKLVFCALAAQSRAFERYCVRKHDRASATFGRPVWRIAAQAALIRKDIS